ncbi:MAG TPA: DMT family transporter [Candidatus Limnocylindria bacterium]|nr:DMT family transporter [Candidatus Limnocylindria bacterium]
MGIILGLAGAVCWGVADFLARFSSRRVGAYRTLLFMQAFGFVGISAYLQWTHGFTKISAHGWQPWAFGAIAGFVNMIASLALYYSFQIGVMSVVAPVSSSYPALTVMLALLSGERVQMLRGVGLAVTLVGVVLASTSFTTDKVDAPADGGHPHARLAKGVVWAIAAAVGFGFLFWFLGFHVVPVLGSVISVWMIRLTSFTVLILAAAPSRQTIKLPRGSVWWLLLGVGLLDTAAFVFNNAGLRAGQVSVVSVLASLYGAVTVVLSWIFLRERLERSQWLGIALIFAGIVLVSY